MFTRTPRPISGPYPLRRRRSPGLRVIKVPDVDQPQPARTLDELHLRGSLALSRGSIDRSAEHRTDDEWLARAWAAEQTRVLVVDGGRVPVGPSGEAVSWARPADVDQTAERYLLGTAGDQVWFAVSAPIAPDVPTAGLRELGPVLPDANWHATHRCCPRCGSPTEIIQAGHVRKCPRDGSDHFPRTDPAVIVLVIDEDGRCLLGRNAQFSDRRFSTLAGFVEPGESLEQAIKREVYEESGVVVDRTKYAGSQPWPFPSSLMLGFYATASRTEITVDGEEIMEAAWFSHAEFADQVRAGELLFPGSVSISRKLIEGWYGGPLPEPPDALG